MKWNVGSKIGVGFASALTIFVIVSIVSWRNVNEQQRDAAWVAHTHEVLGTMSRLLSSLKDVETGQRGFIITGDESYLAPYNASVDAVDAHRVQLAELVSDNPRQLARVQTLGPLIADRLAAIDAGIEARRRGDFTAAQQVVLSGRGKKSMDDIRAQLGAMETTEQTLLANRAAAANAAARDASLTIVLGTALAILASAIIGILIARNVSVPLRSLTSAAERITIGDLGATVSLGDRTDELAVLARAFERMTQSLRVMATVADQIASGDLRASVQPQSAQDVLGHAFLKMSANLRAQIGGLVEGANVLGSAASEIVASTAQLASGASESAAAVSETTTTVEEIRATAQLASQKARAVSDNAQRAVQVSQTGRKSAEDTMTGMGRIRSQMDAIGESMMRLSEQTQAIGQIIATV
jgi:CHASE3 domain sensor protein